MPRKRKDPFALVREKLRDPALEYGGRDWDGLFATLDKDGNGGITHNELYHAIRTEMGLPVSERGSIVFFEPPFGACRRRTPRGWIGSEG